MEHRELRDRSLGVLLRVLSPRLARSGLGSDLFRDLMQSRFGETMLALDDGIPDRQFLSRLRGLFDFFVENKEEIMGIVKFVISILALFGVAL